MLILVLMITLMPAEAQQSPKIFVKEYKLPDRSNAFAITSDDSGNIWVALRNKSSIAKLDPKTGALQEFKIPSSSSILQIWSMVVDSHGNLWFSDATANRIRKFDPSSFKFSEYVIPTPGSEPWGIAIDSKGNIWFATFNSGRLGKLEISKAREGTSNGFVEYKTPTNISRPSYLLFDNNGTLWMMESGPARLAKFDVVAEKFTEISLPRTGNASTNPIGMAMDSQGMIWYTQFRTSNIGRFDPRTNSVEQFSTGLITGASYGIVSDKQGNIWTSQQRVDRIIKISTKDLSISEFRIPTNGSFAENVAVDPSGNVWFVETAGNKIGMIEASVQVPIKTSLSTTKFKVSRNGMVSIPVSLENSEAGDFFPHLRSSMSVTGNIDNSSFSASPDLIQMSSAGSAKITITFTGNNLEPGNYKMVAGFTDRGLNYYQGQFFDLTVEDDSGQTILIIAVIALVLIIALIATITVLSRNKEKKR
jgi:virginiamycin B lyase